MMLTVALTGATGFIGKQFLEAADGRFNVRIIGRSSRQGASNVASLADIDALVPVLAGCDAIVHCAHTSASEELNAIWAEALCTAAARAGVQRIVALGSFATYDNQGSAIGESTRACSAQIPYVAGKLSLERAFMRQAGHHRSLTVAFLQPGIVVGAGGSWDRFARRLQYTQQILLPARGAGLCNAIEVGAVAEAIARALDLDASSFGPERFLKALLGTGKAITWAQWLATDYGIPLARIEACNTNRWAEEFKRNGMLMVRYSRPAAAMLGRFKRKVGAAPEAAEADTPRSVETPVPAPVFVPEGLDRLTLACRAVVNRDRALGLGLVD